MYTALLPNVKVNSKSHRSVAGCQMLWVCTDWWHALQKHGQKWPCLKSGYPPSPSLEAGDCSHSPPIAHLGMGKSHNYNIYQLYIYIYKYHIYQLQWNVEVNSLTLRNKIKFSETVVEIPTFSFTKMHLKITSWNVGNFVLCLNVLGAGWYVVCIDISNITTVDNRLLKITWLLWWYISFLKFSFITYWTDSVF